MQYRFWEAVAYVCEHELHLAQLLDRMYGPPLGF